MNVQQYSTININNRLQQVCSKKLSAVVILGHKRHIIISHVLQVSHVILENFIKLSEVYALQGNIFGIIIILEYKDKKYIFR